MTLFWFRQLFIIDFGYCLNLQSKQNLLPLNFCNLNLLLQIRYLDYLRTVKSAPQENSQTAKFIRETLDLFISKSINTATLDFLFQIRCHSLVISASNHIFFKSIYAFKVITMIFDESFDVIMAEIAQISKNLPAINMKSLLKIVRANLLVRKNTSIISATDGGEERVTGCHTISFDELKQILSFPCSLDNGKHFCAIS